MKKLYLVCIIFCSLLLSARAAGQEVAPVESAKAACEAWLKAVDDGRYDDSWDSAAAGFKSKTPREKWGQVAARVRTPLGTVQTRELETVQEIEAPKNRPSGHYIQINYKTAFTALSAAREALILRLEENEKWCVTSYMVKPAQPKP